MFLDRDIDLWVVEHPLFGRHAVMGSWERAFARAYGAATFRLRQEWLEGR